MSSYLPTQIERTFASFYILIWLYLFVGLIDYRGTLFGIGDIHTSLQFVPILLLWVALPVLLVSYGRVISHSAIFWLTLFLASVILYGSLASMYAGIAFDETFLRYVIIIAPALGAVCIGYNPPSGRINGIVIKAGTIFSFLALGIMIFHVLVSPLSERPQVLKEEMFFTVGIFAARLFSGSEKTNGYRLVTHILAAMIILAGILTTKFTTYFAALMVLACYGIHIVAEGRHVARTLKAVIIGAHIVAVAIVLLPLYFPSNVALPDGSPVAREFLYEYRFAQFLESPWIGTLFVGEQRITGLWRLIVPSHSNVLDLLAMGGVLCFLVYLAIVILSCIAAWRIGRRSVPGPFLHGYGCLVILIYVPLSSIFNPIWGQISLGLTYWLTVGFVAGTALRLSEFGALSRSRNVTGEPILTPASGTMVPRSGDSDG